MRSRWACLLAIALLAAACSGEGRSVGRSEEPDSPGASMGTSIDASSTPARTPLPTNPGPGTTSSLRSSAPPTTAASTGDARVELLVNEGVYEFTGGRCLLDDEGDALAVQVGIPGGDDFFGMAVSAYPELLRSGVAYRTALTARWQGTTLPVHDVRVTLDGNLRSGSFAGVGEETSTISGTFRC